jgi:1,4-dihydroxy-2-naphthoate polyprenyltransferase
LINTIKRAASNWFLAIRPKTLIASIAPVLIASSHALKKEIFSPNIFFLILSFAILIQIGTNLANDYFDFIKGADTENRQGPLRVMQKKLISILAMKIAITSIFSLCLALGILMATIGGYVFILLASLAVFFGIIYTAGPFSLAYNGLGDLVVLIFFGPIAVLGCNYLYSQEFNLECFLAGLGSGFFSCAILNANNIRDIKEDKLAQKKTLAVRFGKKFAIMEYIFCIFSALIIPIILFYYNYANPIALANLALFILFIEPISALFSLDQEKINQVLPKTTHIMTLYTMTLSLSILI